MNHSFTAFVIATVQLPLIGKVPDWVAWTGGVILVISLIGMITDRSTASRTHNRGSGFEEAVAKIGKSMADSLEQRMRESREQDARNERNLKFMLDPRPRKCVNCGSIASRERWQQLGGCPACRCDYATLVDDPS